MSIQPPIINIFEKAVRKAGKIIRRDFGEIENLQIKSKNISDFVTNADLQSEKILIETLKSYYPDFSYQSEEIGNINEGNEEKIVIDPIDGTTNFIHGIPIFAIVISKIHKSEITDGVIFNPITNEFFWASKGKGAWCNNKRLRVSKREDLSESLIGTGIPYANRIYQNYLIEIDNISKITSGLRRLGSAAIDLAYVASGKFDAYWEKNLNIWDIASGALIVKEAGGKITNYLGNNWDINTRDIVASNSLIHNDVYEKLK